MVDFPGLFETRGAELDISIRLTLQYLLQKAKSVKFLLLVSALSFLPDQNQIIKIIKNDLKLMFKQPENNVVVGVTKTRLVDSSLGEDKDELMETFQGLGGEAISFSGH